MKINKLIKSLALAATLLVALPLTSTLQAAEDDGVVRVVYPLDFADIKRVHFMINTVNNLVKHFQSNLTEYEISIVGYGPGIQYMMKDFKGTGFVGKPYLKQGGPTTKGSDGRFAALKALAGDSLQFFACKNTMTKKKVLDKQLKSYVKVTPAGVLKLIQLQSAGAAYIKIK